MNYGIDCISVYDPVAMLPYSEPSITEQTRFKKLGKEMKTEFKWLAASITVEFLGRKPADTFLEKKCRNSEPGW